MVRPHSVFPGAIGSGAGLPAAVEPGNGSPPAAAAVPPPVAGEDSASILVVDDEPVNRKVLVHQIAAEGYEIGKAASGPEALARIEEHPYDLVLLDIMMPRMTGYEVCRTLRQSYPLDEVGSFDRLALVGFPSKRPPTAFARQRPGRRTASGSSLRGHQSRPLADARGRRADEKMSP